MPGKDLIVTPWEVKGQIDYNKLVKEFGTELIDDELIERMERDFGPLHPLLKRKIFYSHRDMPWLLDKYERNEKFFIYTGRGPSGGVHLGHILPWIVTAYFQKKCDATLYFQFTDDEKFLVKETDKLEYYTDLARDNLMDLLALGIDPEKTKVFIDSKNIRTLYPVALNVAKHVTFSTAKAVFGFENNDNIGKIFYTSIQSVLAFLPSVEKGANIPCLIPCGIDQDPHFRITRDVAPKLGFYKPALIHNKLLPGLTSEGKMSSSDPYSVIYTADSDEAIKKKINRAFTGGKATIEEQRRLGANPEICPVYHMYMYLFEYDDRALEERQISCSNGSLLCGECKGELIKRVVQYLKEHRRRREEARKYVDSVLIPP